MTTQLEMALDLSAKPSVTPLETIKLPSPSYSCSSDLDTSLGDQSSSAFSDTFENNKDNTKNSFMSLQSGFIGAKGTTVKPVAGPIPTSQFTHPRLHTISPVEQTEDRLSPTAQLAKSRPFKMYPFDPMSNMYSQMAASAASLSAAGLYNPFAAAAASPGATFPGIGLGMDNAISLSSPITQYLNQKKRRSEGRANIVKSEPEPTNTNAGDISSTSRDQMNGHSATPPGTTPNSPTPSRSDDGSDMLENPAKKLKMNDNEELSVDERRDLSYWDRRRKNNEAAKRSRDARRVKEEEIAIRAAYLEQENLKLRAQVTILKNETTKLHYMLYNRL